jgi:hypothetical protein
MSKLGEYLALIPKGMKNIPQILEAVTNQTRMELGAIPKETQEIIVGRRMICATCPFMSKNAVNGYEIEGNRHKYNTDRDDEHCIWCGCPISTRTASLESRCGLEAYNEEFQSTVPLMWEKEKMYFSNFLKK